MDTNDLFNESELRLMWDCVTMWADERSREAICRKLEIKNILRKLELRIKEGASE
jgi:hypothetical protein